MKMWVVDIRKVCAFFCAVLLPNMALAVTCPSGFSEFLIDDAHVVVPLSERCPDGYSQIYTVDDCADANTGSVCAVCDSDYILGGFANCVELCSADKKTIRFSNDLSFNLLKSSGTKPALNILTANNQQCYVDLAAGNAPGLNFQLPSGATYHAVQHGGGYRVCAPGYTLSYDCGIGGGVPPESQSLLSGYWYTVPASAGSCRVPDGMRFTGWEIDGIKHSPYTIYTYDFDTNKTLTAMFGDASKVYVNYFCETTNSSPVYTDIVTLGEGVAPKTNMCPYDTKKTEPLAWIEPFTQDEINQIIALVESGLDLSMMESFLMPYFGQDGGLLANELSELLFSMLLQYYAQCGNNTDATCTLSRLIYEHTYLDPNAWASDPFDEMYSWFRDIYSDTDLNVLPLYHAAGYNINFDCGKYFMPAAGDLNDIAWTARYGWDKTYYCADLSGRDYSFYVEECIGFSEGGECLQSTTAIDMVGWQIDGSEYEQTFKYIWTTDQNAVAVFDYDLSATFDCGADGVLASGVENVTYTGRNVGTDEISLNIDATCASNANRTFVGWKLVNNDTQYQVGNTLNWLDVFLDANNCISSSCKKLTFEAVYEDILNLNYFCSVDDEIPTYVAKIKSNVGSSLRTDLCKYDTAKNKLNAWVVPFNDQEIAELDAILAGNEMPEFVKKVFIDKSIMYMDSMTEEEQLSLMIYMMYGGSDQSTGDPVIDYIARMVFEHLYLIEGDTKTQIVIDADTDIYALFAAVSYKVNFDCGDIARVEHYMQSNSASYGQEFEIASNCLFNNNSVWSAGNLAEFIGWEIDGNMYTENDSFVWNYTTDKTLTGIYDYNLKATFDCGADGILSTGDAAVEYSGRGDGSTMIPLNITAQCVPNVGKKFVGWSLPYYSGNAIKAGSVLDWLDIVVAHDTYDIDSEVVEFTAVYEDVVDVNYFCSVDDVMPSYTDAYPAGTTSAPLRQSGCDNDTSRYELFGWYTPFTAEETAKLKSYSFDTAHANIWKEIEPVFVNHTRNYVFDQDIIFIMGALWMNYSSANNDTGLKYFGELLSKHWYVVNYTSTIELSGSTDLYAFYTGKYYGVNFDCGMGEYVFWDDWNTGYYGATQKWCDSCDIGDYTSSGWSFAGWEVDGVFHEMCEPFVWDWTQNKTAIGIYDYDMTANFDCGADGTLSGGSATIENKTRGNGTDAMPLNITATCAPNAGKRFVGWSNNGSVYNVGQTLNWLDYVGESVVDFVAVYEDVIDVNYYCSAVDVSPTYTDAYPIGTTSVELRSSGCDYDAQQFNFRGWYTPFTADEVATLKSYSFDTKFPEYWAVIEPTFVNHTSSYTYDYETVFMLTGLYGGYGVGGNDESIKYLTELLQKHWFLVDDSLSMTVSDSVNDVYAFFVEVD